MKPTTRKPRVWLPVAGVPDRPADARRLLQSWPAGRDAKGPGRTRRAYMDVVAALEPDAALGNGGLGWLAACFMESMASVDVPAHGYGIRHANGMFRQEIHDGWQVELPENWLDHGNSWESSAASAASRSASAARSNRHAKDAGLERHRLEAAGAGAGRRLRYADGRLARKRVNTLRLWSAMPIDPILLDAFVAGDHIGALRESNSRTRHRKVLYPADSHMAGPGTPLRQEYFLRRVAAG